MIIKTTIAVICAAAWCQCSPLYSSFWAPLVEPRRLRYSVDAAFDRHAGLLARRLYRARHGHRGETLIAALGDGRGPGDEPTGDGRGRGDEPSGDKVYGDVKFYYTYPGAYNK